MYAGRLFKKSHPFLPVSGFPEGWHAEMHGAPSISVPLTFNLQSFTLPALRQSLPQLEEKAVTTVPCSCLTPSVMKRTHCPHWTTEVAVI